MTADGRARKPPPSRESRAAPSADDAALGLAVGTAKVALAVTRLLARTPGMTPLVARSAETGRAARAVGRQRVTDAAQTALAGPEVGRIVDGALAGPLPERVARSTIEHHVGDRLVAELEAERARWLEQVLDSPEFERALERALSSPKVREALTKQTTTLADEIVGDLRRRVFVLDDRVARRRADASLPVAGLCSRAAAFSVDLVLAHVAFLVAAALVGLVASLVGELRPAWLFGAVAGAGWLLLVGGYFVFFWTLGGQTPAMRLLRLRVTDPTGRAPGAGRSLLRFATLLLAIVPLFAGLITVVFDRRRRGLHDYIARTVVVRTD